MKLWQKILLGAAILLGSVIATGGGDRLLGYRRGEPALMEVLQALHAPDR